MKDLPPDINSLGPVRKSRRQSIAPCEMRVQEAIDLLADVRRKEPELYYKTLGELALADYWIYLRLVLDYRFLDPWDHGEEQIWFLQENLGHPMLFLVPRGGCKTGAITIPFVPWMLAHDPTSPCIITNVREEKAAYFAKQAAKICTAKNFARCFPHIKPSEKWGEGGYYLKETANVDGGAGGRVDPNIGSYGVGGNITGAHGRVLLHDDLINRETYQHASQLQKAEDFFSESLNCLDPGGQLIVAGTRWSFLDLYGKMVDGKLFGSGEPFRVFLRGAERISLDDQGKPVIEVFNPHRVYLDFRGKQQQVGYTREFLESQKKNSGALYYALYQNQPVHDGDRQFNVEAVKTFKEFSSPLGPVFKVGIEIVSTAISFWEAFRKMVHESGRIIPLERLQPPVGKHSVAKHARIRAILAPRIDSGEFQMLESLWHREGNLGEEIRQFDKGADDALDAVVYCMERAPRYEEGKLPRPYIAVDPAFTAAQHSDSTAIVCGCWFGNEFFVLDCHKFKAAKLETIANQIFRMYDRFKDGIESRKLEKSPGGGFASPGNERRSSRMPGVTWGPGRYINNGEKYEAKDRRSLSSARRFR